MMFLCLLSIFSLMSLTLATSCTLTPAKDNMVAARLEGNWTVNALFSAHLSPDGKTSTAPVGEVIVSFSNASSVLADLSGEKCDLLKSNNLEIYLAGTLQFLHIELGIMSHIFVLTSIEGVSAIVYWQGDNIVTNLLQVAPAIIPQHDLLFMGETSSDKPFSVLERAGTKGAICGDQTPRQ